MNPPRLKEVTQVCLQSCCPDPIFNTPELEQERTRKIQSTTSSVCRHNFASVTKSSFFPSTHFTNHESIPSFQESYVQFVKTYPKYEETATIDKIRAQEYGKLDDSNHCVTLTMSGLASSRSLKLINLKAQLIHGGEGSELESAIKKRIMDFLKISQNDYHIAFTANKSSAYKLVAESYPFQSSRKLLTVYDHESEALEGMINVSEKRGARVMAAEFKWPRMRIRSIKLQNMIVRKKMKTTNSGLFVFPLQSRMTGVSYSYQWMTMAQEHGWHVLFDACSLGPKEMDSFGLSLYRPDFLVCSFYKIFGENPTGFGCLLVKKNTAQILEDSTGAGIVSITPSKDLFSFVEDSSGTDTELEKLSKRWTEQDYVRKISDDNECSKMECRCLDQVDSLGLILLSSRRRYLINWLVNSLMKLQHPNRLENFPLVTIYGPKVKFDRGQALAFNIYDWKGEKIDPILVQKLADRNNISLSHGFLHHIWFQNEDGEHRTISRNIEGKKASRIKNCGNKQGITVVTAALTFLTNFKDVYMLWAFIARFLDADFVEKEKWRYTALNQKTIEV
ncbi:molybdenum cofactor sulfurase [Dorcoceras hygrometricum]|uniref:Molybdenum cofactor sulfurase n=1 Tax=Dorcoceras hygrometricum TaxID=472368 RepID=A0A2Z7DC54_9LAMI|nr:molybdenum cofactor sulfurase [Dorcoceras hygrometricum]